MKYQSGIHMFRKGSIIFQMLPWSIQYTKLSKAGNPSPQHQHWEPNSNKETGERTDHSSAIMSDVTLSSKRRRLIVTAVAYEEAVICMIPIHIASIKDILILRRAYKDSNTEPLETKLLIIKVPCIIVWSS